MWVSISLFKVIFQWKSWDSLLFSFENHKINILTSNFVDIPEGWESYITKKAKYPIFLTFPRSEFHGKWSLESLAQVSTGCNLSITHSVRNLRGFSSHSQVEAAAEAVGSVQRSLWGWVAEDGVEQCLWCHEGVGMDSSSTHRMGNWGFSRPQGNPPDDEIPGQERPVRKGISSWWETIMALINLCTVDSYLMQ